MIVLTMDWLLKMCNVGVVHWINLPFATDITNILGISILYTTPYLEESMHVCMYVCMYLCIYVCMYVCMHVCVTVLLVPWLSGVYGICITSASAVKCIPEGEAQGPWAMLLLRAMVQFTCTLIHTYIHTFNCLPSCYGRDHTCQALRDLNDVQRLWCTHTSRYMYVCM